MSLTRSRSRVRSPPLILYFGILVRFTHATRRATTASWSVLFVLFSSSSRNSTQCARTYCRRTTASGFFLAPCCLMLMSQVNLTYRAAFRSASRVVRHISVVHEYSSTSPRETLKLAVVSVVYACVRMRCLMCSMLHVVTCLWFAWVGRGVIGSDDVLLCGGCTLYCI